MVTKEQCNPVKPLPWNEGAFDTYTKYGTFMFPQQRKIYENISKRLVPHSTVLEAGCGIGLGTAILDRSLTTKIIGTDNLQENVTIARNLYPWIKFERWDLSVPTVLHGGKYDVVIAIEVVEHVNDPLLALKELCWNSLKEVYVSTPNGRNKPRPPSNPYHVLEYTTQEIIDIIKGIQGDWNIEILDYATFAPLDIDTEVDPVVYHLTRGKF